MRFISMFFLFSFFCSTAGVLDVSVSLGPGFDYSAQHLLPVSNRVGHFTFLETFNYQSAWNLFTCFNGVIKAPITHYFDITAEVDGGWLRNGNAVVTNSEIGLLDGQSSPLNVVVHEDAINVAAGGGISFFKEKPVACRVSAGYTYGRVLARLPFLQSTLIFFETGKYRGPYFGCDVSVRINEDSILKIFFKEVFGTTRIRATENDTDEIVLRYVPRMFATVIGCKLVWQINDSFSLAPQLFYLNTQNHQIGFTITKNDGIFQKLQNVDALIARQFVFLLEFGYSF